MKLVFAGNLKSRLTADFGVTTKEIEECFLNRESSFKNSNSDNLSFVAKTDRGRMLRVRFNIKDKLVHILQLPGRSVSMEQEGTFCEITEIETMGGLR
ncbi:MAG: hypothetical protein JST89_00600 [Cyanobacteria bacterium SZAS-4]|nr:hypothetical protein [Cyanobacteria bacterium SZAS-4]